MQGSVSATGRVGPIHVSQNALVSLTLAGTWVGTVLVLRKAIGMSEPTPLTLAGSVIASFTANCQEVVWQEPDSSSEMYFDFTRTSGTLEYSFQE